MGVVRAFRRSKALKELEEMEDQFNSIVKGAEVLSESIEWYEGCGVRKFI